MATPTRPDIRAAFFDIDGTLLPFGAQQIPADTRAALAALRRQGVGVYIATGRPPVHLPALKPLQGVEFDGFVTAPPPSPSTAARCPPTPCRP